MTPALPDTAGRYPPPQNTRVASFGYQDVFWLALTLLVIFWAFFYSYQKWLNPVVDSGRDLYIPEALLHGRKLYRDINYVFPPLTPYLLSWIVRVFGSSLSVYTAVGLGVSAVSLAALYLTARTIVHPTAAGLVALLFAALHFAGVAGSNFLFPYAHAATFGVAFLLVYIFFVTLYLFVERRESYYFLGFAFALLSAWTKLEFALTAVISLAAVFSFYKLPVRCLLWSFLIATGSWVTVSLFFVDSSPGHHWLWSNVFPLEILTGSGARFFYLKVFATEQLSTRAAQIFSGVLLFVSYAGAVGAIDRVCVSESRGLSRYRGPILAILMGFLLFLCWQLADVRFYRSWAALEILLIPAALTQGRRSPLLFLLLVSICSSSRIFFNLSPSWYGFYLTLPTYLLITYVLFKYLPERRIYSGQAAMLWLPVFLLLMIRGQIDLVNYYSTRTHRIDTVRGSFYDSSATRAGIIQDLLRHTETQKHTGLVVMPEGLVWNYLAKISNPLSFHTFTPAETASREIEQRIIEELKSRRPELIAINNRSVGEFGYRGFGIDYNQRVVAYVEKHYLAVQVWKAPDFELTLLKLGPRRADLP